MEDLEYITYKAMIECDQGSVPGLFTPTYNQTTKINSCLVSTKVDQIPIANIPDFVVCKKTGGKCTPAPTVWLETYPVKVKGQPTLIGKSCNNCAVGGKIGFLTSGQVPLSPEEEAELQGMRDDVKKAYDEEQEEKNKPWWQKAGEFVVDCVPVVGPIVSLVKNVSKGNWGMALLDVGFLALDVVSLVAAPVTGGASVAGAAAVKVGARQAIKGAVKQVAKKLSREALEAAAKQTVEMLSKLSVRRLTAGRLCVFACFPAGTPVATKDGLKNIEEIQVGDEVWSYDEHTGEIGLKPVVNTFTRTTDLLIKLEINGEVITTTPEHPFYANGEWKEAGLLEVDDHIMLFSGKLAKVNAVTYQGVHAPVEINDDSIEDLGYGDSQSSEVYNFEVQDWHTYFVNWLKILVHNAGGICLKQVVKEIKAGKKKLREILLGRTPGKGSATGTAVKKRMKSEGTFRTRRGKEQFKSKKDGKWYDVENADMAHKTDAVTWWKQNLGKYQARSPEVRKWMRDSDNYYLEHFKHNRSDGAKLGEKYLLPPK